MTQPEKLGVKTAATWKNRNSENRTATRQKNLIKHELEPQTSNQQQQPQSTTKNNQNKPLATTQERNQQNKSKI